MPVPSTSNYPTSLDADSSLGGDAVNLTAVTLSGAINNSATTITTTATLTNVNVPCWILIDSELIYVETKSGADFTGCNRGAGGTSAASHSSGATAKVVYAANHFNQLKRAIIAVETALGADPLTKAIGTTKGDIITFTGSGAPVRQAVGTDTHVLIADSAESDGIRWESRELPDGFMINGKISVTVSSNNLTVALKTKAGTDPSATDPVIIWINGTRRTCTAALSVTKNAGTNWFGSGGTMFATKEVDYFVYLIWNTTPGTDIMDIGFARIPFGTVYSDFSGTSTNEKYLAQGNASAPTATDDVCVIGRFAATLSAGAGYTWTVPTFTNKNLIQRPVYDTRWLDYLPTYGASAPMTFTAVTTSLAIYQIRHQLQEVKADFNGTTGVGATNILTFTLPFSVTSLASGLAYGTAYVLDAAASAGYWRVYPGGFGLTGVEVLKGDESAFGLAAGKYTRGSIITPI